MSGRGRGRGRGYAPPTGAQLFLRRSLDECGLGSHTNLRTVQDITRPRLFPDLMLHSSGDQKKLLVDDQQREQQQALAAGQGGGVKFEGASAAPGAATSATSGGAGGAGTATATADKKAATVHSIPRSAQTVALISKSREIHHRLQNSVYYVRPTKDVPDVVRYSDSKRPPPVVDASAVLSNCLGGRKRTRVGLYVPEELGAGQRRGGPGRGGGLGVGDAIAAGRAVDLKELEEREVRRARAGSVGGPPSQAEGGGGPEEEDYIEQEVEEEEGEDYVMNYYESEGDEDGDADGEPTF